MRPIAWSATSEHARCWGSHEPLALGHPLRRLAGARFCNGGQPVLSVVALLNPRVWIGLALAAALAFSHLFVYRAGRAAIQQKWDIQKAADIAAARQTEQAWQASADATTKAKDDQIRTVNRRLAAALLELRNRPERPAVLPENSSTCRSGTGAGLYAPDAEFLSGLSASAATVAAERDACIAQYNGLRAPVGR